MRLLLPLLLTLLSLASVSAPARTFDVREFGAKGDGRALDTDAINRAIAAAADAGGGTVHFPSGTYLSFSIHLRSNVALYLDMGAVIEAAEPPADLSHGYDAPEPNPRVDYYEDFGHSHWKNSLIWGIGLENIAILGPGRIYGRGLSRGTDRRDLLPSERAMDPAQQPDLSLPAAAQAAIAAQKSGPFNYPGKDTLPAGVGNKAIALKNCRNVTFRDFTLVHAGHFAVLATGVDNWICDGLTIDTNRDGIDFDCCRNVRVSNCSVNSPRDDALVLKSSYGLGEVRPTENVTLTNCIVSGFEEGTLLDGRRIPAARNSSHSPIGRIKFGTEANGGFRNIAITNCVFEHCCGLALEEVDGGRLEDVTISNITMRHVGNAPIFIRLGARKRGPEGTPDSVLRRVKISNVVAHDVSATSGILILGLPGTPIEDVSLSDIFIEFRGGGTAQQAMREVPELEREYPEPSRFGTMPSWGLFARHVRNLTLSDIELRTLAEDKRPPVILDDVAGVRLDNVKAPAALSVEPMVLRNVTDISR